MSIINVPNGKVKVDAANYIITKHSTLNMDQEQQILRDLASHFNLGPFPITHLSGSENINELNWTGKNWFFLVWFGFQF